MKTTDEAELQRRRDWRSSHVKGESMGQMWKRYIALASSSSESPRGCAAKASWMSRVRWSTVSDLGIYRRSFKALSSHSGPSQIQGSAQPFSSRANSRSFSTVPRDPSCRFGSCRSFVALRDRHVNPYDVAAS